MSDDFDFNADDLFDDFDDDDDDFGGDDFDDDFGGNDDLGGDDDFGADLDLDFMDDDDDFGDDDFDDDFGDDDDFDLGDDGGSGGDGPQISRPIMIIAGAMFIILIIALGLIAFSIIGGGDGGFQETADAIEAINNDTFTQIAETETQSSVNSTVAREAEITGTAEGTTIAQTDIAVQLTDTSEELTQVVLDQTEAAQIQETANADMTASADALLDADAQATQAAQDAAQSDADAAATDFELTLNPVQVSPVPIETTPAPAETMPTEIVAVDLPAVAQTATALASLFEATLTPADVSGGTEIAAGATQRPPTGGGDTSQLPDTGLADDLFQAFFGDPRLAILAAFGLMGVIVISRGVRSANRKKDDD